MVLIELWTGERGEEEVEEDRPHQEHHAQQAPLHRFARHHLLNGNMDKLSAPKTKDIYVYVPTENYRDKNTRKSGAE